MAQGKKLFRCYSGPPSSCIVLNSWEVLVPRGKSMEKVLGGVCWVINDLLFVFLYSGQVYILYGGRLEPMIFSTKQIIRCSFYPGLSRSCIKPECNGWCKDEFYHSCVKWDENSGSLQEKELLSPHLRFCNRKLPRNVNVLVVLNTEPFVSNVEWIVIWPSPVLMSIWVCFTFCQWMVSLLLEVKPMSLTDGSQGKQSFV